MRTAVVLCGPLSGLSGGDVHALRLADALEMRAPGTVAVHAPELMRENLPERSRALLRPLRTPLDARLAAAGGMGLYLACVLLRMLACIARAPRSDVDVAGSHLFHDVIPCVVRRLLRRTGAVVTYVYHLIEEEREDAGARSRASIALERLSVALLRASRALVFVDNEPTRDALLARGLRPPLVRMTGNAYDPWVPLPPRTRPASPVLVTVGRLTQEKGILDALEVARRLPGVQLVHMGDGPLRDEVRRLAADLPNVELCGFVSEQEKWRRLRSATAFIAPSREEGWGIAVGEALAAGLPVVAYDLPAYAHLPSGALRTVALGDLEGFCAACAAVLDAGDDAAVALPVWRDVLDAEIATIEARSRLLA